jgi:hypothetical protein
MLVRGGPRPRADRARALAGDIAKDATERPQAPPAGVEGDLGDRQIAVAQQRRRPLDAPREQVAVRRDAEGLLERAGEVSLGRAADARQPPDGPVLVRSGVHPILRAQQAAQQLGVLACRQRLIAEACAHGHVSELFCA